MKKGLFVLIAGIILWYYIPRFFLFYGWPLNPNFDVIMTAIFVAGGLICLLALLFAQRNKQKKEKQL
jgi:type VI protein secretion system component VasK